MLMIFLLYVPVIIVSDTVYNRKVPMIIGTNVLKVLQNHCTEPKAPALVMALRHLASAEMNCQDVAVYCKAQVRMPAGKSVVLQGRIGATRSYRTGLLQSADSLPGGLIMPECAVSVNDNTVPLQVTNVSNHMIVVPKSQKLAVYSNACFVSSSTDKFVNNVNVMFNNAGVDNNTEVLDKLRDVKLNDQDLSPEQRKQVHDFLGEWTDVFAANTIELGQAKGVKHSIKLTDAIPFKERPRRIPPHMYE